MIIAVDGPTASGKGTIAQALAAHFGLPHLDTGLLYRAVGRQLALHRGNPDSEADALAACTFPDSLLADPELRSEETGGLASQISVHPAVRAALFQRQRAFATQPGGAVLDGRDIGTVIAPEAEVKLFVTANIEARARRRFHEMQAAGRKADLAAIAADLAQRDARDSTRSAAPLRMAGDALPLDTSDLEQDAAIAAAIAMVEPTEWDYEKFPVGSDEHWFHEEKIVFNTRKASRLWRLHRLIRLQGFRRPQRSFSLFIELVCTWRAGFFSNRF